MAFVPGSLLRGMTRRPHVPDVAPCVQCGLAEQHRAHCPRNGTHTATSTGPMEADPWDGPLGGVPLCLYRVNGVDYYGFATAVSDDDELELCPDAGGEPVRVRLGECEYIDMVA